MEVCIFQNFFKRNCTLLVMRIVPRLDAQQNTQRRKLKTSVSHRGLEGLRARNCEAWSANYWRIAALNSASPRLFCNTLAHFKGGELSQLALPFEQKLGGT
jgi:hypothetical protein